MKVINIITIFPEMFSYFKYGIVSRAIKKNMLKINYYNPKNFIKDKKSIDDKIYGGGSGMLMKAEPIIETINNIKKKSKKTYKVIYLTPQGKKLNQKNVILLSMCNNFILLCGRYEGIDSRIIKYAIDEEWSIGNYIISGGELAAMVLVDSITRYIPGIINSKSSIFNDSFSFNLLDYDSYTKPYIYKNMKVPKVLLSGNHIKIKRWRKKNALVKTFLKSRNLIKKKFLKNAEKKILLKFKKKNFL
ncbi:MAG: tRNA (guanosine(37)-N1)-methyltransferase TrmD [Enterobacteriaceae bacterium]